MSETLLHSGFDERKFRDALGAYTTGITIVTCNGPEGPMGITANSFSSLSLDPPLVLWSPAKSSRRHDAFVNASEFAIHIASYDQMDLCSEFSKSAYGPAEVSWEWSDKGCPYINGSSARLMCSKYAKYDGGDHTIIVGLVVDFIHNGEVPLAFSSGKYIRGIS